MQKPLRCSDPNITHVVMDSEPALIETRLPILRSSMKVSNRQRASIASRARIVTAPWVFECIAVGCLFSATNAPLEEQFLCHLN
jgi:hypothetical protein